MHSCADRLAFNEWNLQLYVSTVFYGLTSAYFSEMQAVVAQRRPLMKFTGLLVTPQWHIKCNTFCMISQIVTIANLKIKFSSYKKPCRYLRKESIRVYVSCLIAVHRCRFLQFVGIGWLQQWRASMRRWCLRRLCGLTGLTWRYLGHMAKGLTSIIFLIMPST